MKKLGLLIFIAAILCSALSLSAQNARSAYFVNDYAYRYQLNPAFGNSRGFVSMPALGNLDLTMNGNLRLTDIFHNVDGRTTTFMNPRVDAAAFLDRLDDVSKLNASLRVDVINVGFKALGGYNTVGISVRNDIGMRLPKSLFSFLKEGITNRRYNIKNAAAREIGYAEISLGHSRDITDEWRVGLTAKMLLGGAAINARLRSAELHLNEDVWHITSDAKVNTSLKGASCKTDLDENSGREYVSGIEVSRGGIGGYGFAVDLGAVYRPSVLPDWTFSASVLDFGGIGWSNNVLATTDGPRSFTTDDYVFNVDDNAPNSFGKEFDRVRDRLSALYELQDCGDRGGRSSMLAATINLAAEYEFPLYRQLTFGLLNTTRINGCWSWTDFRLSANANPLPWISGSANVAVGTCGFSFGWLLNFSVTGFNLFAGMDHAGYKISKGIGIPLSPNASFNFGINFPF